MLAPTFLLTITVAACGSNSGNGVGSATSDQQVAQVSVALSGGDFSGNSVRICGTRSPAPDGKYRCDSSLSPADSDATECPCFNFAADGSLVGQADGGPAILTGLCPTVDFPNGDWTFTYAVFASPDCEGTQLNDGTHNFTCFDSHDIGTQAHHDETFEESLVPGLNVNHILCTTENASKEWIFSSCAIATTAADSEADVPVTRFDCGCTATGPDDACECGDAGEIPVQMGCTFDPTTCNILCPTSLLADAGPSL